MGGAPYKCAKEGGGHFLNASAYDYKRVPMSRLQQIYVLELGSKQIIGQTIMYSRATIGFEVKF